MTEGWIDLSGMSALPDLFNRLLRGVHIGRLNESALWASLEANAEKYTELFAALGFELRVDQRGFAWLENPREEQQLSTKVRPIALMLMLVFERQAAQGRSLEEFDRWVIDHEMLRQILIDNKDMLETSGYTSLDKLEGIMTSATRYGFAQPEDEGWRLLPAIRRFTDQFEALADASDLSMQDDEEEESRG